MAGLDDNYRLFYTTLASCWRQPDRNKYYSDLGEIVV